MNCEYEEITRPSMREKKRVVVKIGSSSLVHPETGDLNYTKLDVLVRELCNMHNAGMDVILVSSGAIAAGKQAIGSVAARIESKNMGFKQACAAIGQARLMSVYSRLFSEYNNISAQILMTKNIITDPVNRENAYNTFNELLNLGVVPIVNENDTVSTYEIIVDDKDVLIGDNDTLSALVAALVGADLLILLSDVDGLYTDDPRTNPDAQYIYEVDELTEEYMNMGKKSTGSNVGTGGMNTKMNAAKISTSCGADMIIANSEDIRIIHRIMDGRQVGTLFKAHKDENFDILKFIEECN
ncbi:MAG: glutamate 5-kinase [Lachnospiraceae bacterium]|nr:glutamate 5-kinase [Lachnospiraceae bacterium]